MKNKEKYLSFCKGNENISIFLQPWYINSLLDDGEWDVSIYEKNDEIIGALVYRIKEGSFKEFVNIPFSGSVNPFIKINREAKRLSQIKNERRILSTLFSTLGKYDYLRLKLNYNIYDWRPIKWLKRFDQSTSYSSVLKTSKLSLDEILKDAKGSIRTDIKKAEKALVIEDCHDALEIYDLLISTFSKKSKKLPIEKGSLEKLIDNCLKQGVLYSKVAKDKDGKKVGFVLCIKDVKAYFYIMGGADTKQLKLGSQSLLIYDAIKNAHLDQKDFDFEGSMIESVDNFFISFSPQIVPYSLITSTPNRLLKIYKFFKAL